MPEFDSNKISEKTIQNADNSEKTIGNSARAIVFEPEPAPSQPSSRKIEKDPVVEISFHNESENHWKIEIDALKEENNALKMANATQKTQISAQRQELDTYVKASAAQKQ